MSHNSRSLMDHKSRTLMDLYMELLETTHGRNFDFDVLSNDELIILEQLAINEGKRVHRGKARDTAPVLLSIKEQWQYRDRYKWLHARSNP